MPARSACVASLVGLLGRQAAGSVEVRLQLLQNRLHFLQAPARLTTPCRALQIHCKKYFSLGQNPVLIGAKTLFTFRYKNIFDPYWKIFPSDL